MDINMGGGKLKVVKSKPEKVVKNSTKKVKKKTEEVKTDMLELWIVLGICSVITLMTLIMTW